MGDDPVSLSEALAEAKKVLQDGSDSARSKAKTRFLTTRKRAPEVLSGLAAYYSEVPSQMARFVKDEEILAETTRVCEERERENGKGFGRTLDWT